MAQNTDVTLFFCKGAVPTAAELAAAAAIPGIVRMRNVEEDDGRVEESDYVTAGQGVTIPTQYAAVDRFSTEQPVSLVIVPNNPTYDLSDVEHGDLRAIATFADGTTTDVTTSCAWVSATPGVCTIGAATGIVTPVGAGTSVITATYNWAGEGEAGAVQASKALTFATPPDIDDTVVIGLITYTWKETPAATASATAVQVKTATDMTRMARNLFNAVNGGPGRGVDYSSDAPVNTQAYAELNEAMTVLTAKALDPGTGGNAITVGQTGGEATWAGGATALSGGTNSTAAVEDTTTVTIAA
jgi:hypothetical protein